MENINKDGQEPMNSTWGDLVNPKTEKKIEIKPETQSETQPAIESEIPSHVPLWKQILKGLAVFIGAFIFIYLFLTFPAQWAKIRYFFTHLGPNANQPQKVEVPQNINTDSELFLSTIKDALDKAQDKPVKKTSLDITDLENNTLIVPKLDVKVPIIWESPPDEETMLKNLQGGVVHYAGTGLPDQSDGNVFISGHSSYYWWDKGKYKTVFANLDQLVEGDEMALAYKDKIYFYKVYEKIVVKPEQVDVMSSQGKPILTLMTCVPVGTNLNRLIVRADRIDIAGAGGKPVESSPTASTTPTATQTPVLLPTLQENNLWNFIPWMTN